MVNSNLILVMLAAGITVLLFYSICILFWCMMEKFKRYKKRRELAKQLNELDKAALQLIMVEENLRRKMEMLKKLNEDRYSRREEPYYGYKFTDEPPENDEESTCGWDSKIDKRKND